MAIHIGHQRAGWRGLAVAGICFILPAMLMVMVFASAYTRFGSLPEIQSGLYGVKPVIIAVILQAFWGLSRAAVKNPFLAAVGLAATIAALAGLNVLVVLLAAGRVASASVAIREPRLSCHPASLAFLLPSSALSVAVPVSLSGVFVVFLKFGAVIFGSGYVLLAFLQADLVTRLHWLSQAQLLDAVAVGR
jgi:chromate transporter